MRKSFAQSSDIALVAMLSIAAVALQAYGYLIG